MGRTIEVTLPTLHADQERAFWLDRDLRAATGHSEYDPLWERNAGGRYKVVRCGRRWGKTLFGETWLSDGAIDGEPTAWFAPNYKYLTEVMQDLEVMLAPVTRSFNKSNKILRTINGGSIEFWTLEDERAGRSRKYRRVVIDEAAFTGITMLKQWEKSIKPTLLDYSGRCLVASNTNGIDEENFLYQICRQPQHGFIEYHAPSISNPLIPIREPGESEADYVLRRAEVFADMEAREHPQVWLQEYLAEFVDWGGVAFFSKDKLLIDGKGIAMPTACDLVFVVIDTANKTGQEHDGTAATYFAYSPYEAYPLKILDWELHQIEGASLESWLPGVFRRLEQLARMCGARSGSGGALIEDAASGTILIQQAQRTNMRVTPINSKLTGMGKDERAILVSGHVYRGEVKFTEEAYNKTMVFKGASRNHLMTQITGFKIGDKEASKRADDALDTFTYGIAATLGKAQDI